MFLSTGGTNISVPINSAVGIGETKVLQANLAANLNSATFVSGNANTVLDTAGNSNWQFYVASSTSVAAITSSSASSEWTGGSLLSYFEDYYVLYYNFDTTLVSGSNVYNTVSKSYDATLVNATVVTTSPSPSVFGTDRGYLVCTAANYLQINGTYRTGLTGTSIATWINVTGAGGDIFKSSDGTQSSIRLFVSGGTSIALTVSNNSGDGFYSSTLYTNAAVNNGSWHHVVLILTPIFALSTTFTNSSGNSGLAGGVARWQLFFDGVSVFDNTWGYINAKYPDYIVRGTNKIGPITALIDDFRVYDMALTTAQVIALYNGTPPTPTLKHVASGATWMSKPAIAVDSTETNYTIKSNEIALAPGANSTYAVWTAPKTTNVKVDVSFADYHTRSAGVGFQMFKINADNTFGSVIFPRTVTSTALTNAAPNNYLSVPSRSVSVTTGDKIYLRIDANGNPTSASSVLSTNIYVDPNPDLKQPILLQAHLGNNMAATTFVSGNANVVADTRGTGYWKFYAANSNSIASITGASNSTEWTGGSLLTYSAADYSVFYPFNTNTVSGSTVLNMATNAYDLTLYGGASIINTVPSPASQPPSTGSGYLQMNTSTGQYAQATQMFSLNPAGSTISLWFRWTAGSADVPIFSYDDGNNFVLFYIFSEVWFVLVKKIGGTQTPVFNFNATQENITIGNWVHITILTATGTTYVNGVLSQQPSLGTFSSFTQPTKFYLGNSSASPTFLMDGRDFATKTGTIGVDNFVIYNKTLTTTEITALYAKTNLYYPFETADINPGNPLQVGDVSTGPYVYNGTLVNGATIVADAGSRVAGQGYLKLVKASGNYFNFNPISVTTSGFTIAIWFRATTNNVTNSRIFDMFANGGANLSISIRTSPEGIDFQYSTNLNLYTGTVRDNVWRHIILTISYAGASGASSIFKCYIDGTLQTTYTSAYPTLGSKNNYNLGTFLNLGNGGNESFDGGLDDFRIYQRVITDAEITYLYSGPPQPTLKDDATGVAWMPIPATPIDASETSYTIKNNEVALKPGTNSTFAVWTATKFTNLKIDVSFADYHTRSSAGVGFQMFKIKSDNTFDSVLFPRTVTSTALTNAAPNNYLPVPSVSTSVSAGDKIYLRVDANGNTTAASSILATTIFTDAISIANNPVENRSLQAHLGNNLNATTFVSGNANVVLDTLGTSNWQFYVAPSTSVAAITSSSASSEWTGGSLLGAQYAFDGTLVNGASIVVDAGSRVPGNPYLKLSNPVILTNSQYAKFTPVSIPSGGMSFSMWVKHTHVSGTYPFFMSIRTGLTNIDMGLNNTSLQWYGQAGGARILVGFFSTITDGNWHHLVWTISASGMYNFYLDNSLKLTQQSTHPGAGLRSTYNLGGYNDQSDPLYAVNGGIDNFKLFTRELTASEVTAEYNNTVSSMPFMLMTDSGAAPKWTIKPATLADPSETSYTVKSNEIALTPGTNSTYAVWTAPKTTNIKVDVSFADYHSRNVGVGFQMFKINADNTFGSVIFPRTVTSTALTNANSSNYLTVPSKTISVATGDKLYYRIDANGNTTAASSVLATTIYIDPNQDLKQYNVLQANLGNNIAATTFVSGNANVVADTRGTGNWKFYVAGGNSIASVTGLSNSTEWTGGSLLTYSAGEVYANPNLYYPLEVADINPGNPLQVGEFSTGSYVYNGTLIGGATIAVDAGSRIPGKGYLKATSTAHKMSLPPVSTGANGLTFALWFKMPTICQDLSLFDFNDGGDSNNQICVRTAYLNQTTGEGPRFYTIIGSGGGYGGIYVGSFSEWTHFVFILTPPGNLATYANGLLQLPVVTNYAYPSSSTRVNHNVLGRQGSTLENNAGVDDFRFYNRAITAAEVTTLYSGPSPPSIKDSITGATWMPIPATPVDASETSYTIKNNEVALKPGTNSTFAVWTATKSTNLKIDVSFADYHTRSAGVGFQMFKIKSDNTFDSVLFPRTVTSTALTNAAPNNYLPVPSVTTNMNNGDKIYIRVDANGNTTAASSVLATNIYTDAVSIATNPAETRALQANLASNLNVTTPVSGTSNTVLDTVGNGDWKFYVAGGNSIASISSASNSTEWTGGSLLSYNEIDYYMFYPFNTNGVSGSTLLNLATNSYGATLYGGASIVNTVPSPATQPPAIGSGYLNMDIGAGQYVQLNQTVTLNSSGSTISFWFRWSANVSNDGTPIFSYDDGTDYLIIYMWGNGTCVIGAKRNGITNAAYVFGTNDLAPFTIGDWVHLSILTGTGKTYVNGIVLLRDIITGFSSIQPTKMYFGNSSASASFLMDNRTFSTKSGTVGIDNFVIHNKTLSDEEIGALYSNSRIYYTFDSDSVTGNNVGNKSKGTYVNDATLVNGASIVSTAFTFSVVNSGSGAYLINTVSNATINLVRGGQYTFNINASGHPFWIQTSTTPYNSANVYSTGITNNGVQVGTLTFNVPMDAPNTLYYVCQYHGSMFGIINIGTSNPSSAPTSGTGHLQLTSTNTIATNQCVQLSVVPDFIYQNNRTSFSVSFWARSNSTLGSSAKNNFFDFANSIAASENANYSFSMYLQSNNIRGKISYGASGVAADDYVIHTDSSILTDNVWRHYVWTVSSGYNVDFIVRWKLYINSVLVFTKSSGFNFGYPMDYNSTFGGVSYTNSFIGRDAGSWQTASFSGAIDEFRWYKSRVIGQAEVSVLYATQVSVGKFQNPSGGNPTWIAKPTFAVDSTETLYTIKSNEIALAPGANSTYAVWTAPKSTNIRVDVSFADYHSRSSAGVGFQMFKINNDNTFGSTIFPRTVTSTALTNAAPNNYLNVPSASLSVSTGDKIYYRVDANGNTTSASSVISTNIYSYTGKWN